MIVEPLRKLSHVHTCGMDCGNWTAWRENSLDNRTMWKAMSSALLLANCAWYLIAVCESPVLMFMGGTFLVKLLIEIWAQHTPTWMAPSTWPLLIGMHVLALPGLTRMFGQCRIEDVAFPYRELVALALYCIGSTYSLAYEIHRFWWKAQPENEGRLHTTGLARFCIHPNYFGDFFTYLGWGMATGTYCGMGMAPMMMHWLMFMVIPNSDAYLAQKYPDEFAAYQATTAPLIPGVKSPTLNTTWQKGGQKSEE